MRITKGTEIPGIENLGRFCEVEKWNSDGQLRILIRCYSRCVSDDGGTHDKLMGVCIVMNKIASDQVLGIVSGWVRSGYVPDVLIHSSRS
jgi:hypothetical protein